jgi:hypothetical protein
MKKVSVTNSYMSLLKDYSDRTGISVARCVSEALSDWLTNVAPLALDYVNQQSPGGSTRYQNLIFMKSRNDY